MHLSPLCPAFRLQVLKICCPVLSEQSNEAFLGRCYSTQHVHTHTTCTWLFKAPFIKPSIAHFLPQWHLSQSYLLLMQTPALCAPVSPLLHSLVYTNWSPHPSDLYRRHREPHNFTITTLDQQHSDAVQHTAGNLP